MMNFNAPYNRENLVDFLQYQFLPSDYQPNEQDMGYVGGKSAKILSITELGYCESLNLHVLEVKHNSSNDARVSIAKEIFSFLRDNAWYNCLVAFVPNDNRDVYRLSFIKQTPKLINNKLDWDHSNPKRYSFLLGVGQHIKTPTQSLLNKGIVKDIADLSNRFSIEVLTNEFYNELFQWYEWAQDDKLKVTYPNDTEDPTDDRIIQEHLIRLITRLMFVWFIKQKKLVPEQIFDENELSNILVDFDKDSKKDGKYYNAILQNLFFASLNKPIKERNFASEGGDKGNEHYGIKTLFRDDKEESWFKISHSEVVDIFKKVPFLNGGLFECLDKEKNKRGQIYYWDGFSRESGRNKRAFLPNCLFFDKYKGLINILKKYNFTVEENTPSDIDVALDPELLGKVFENLLAAYDPETGKSARKASGSFYTPREFVDYMVNKSLVSYLEQNVGKDWQDKSQETVVAIHKCKIIDPACGSGAFPMGILNKMLEIIKESDPNTDVYGTKLALIKDCIYGVDIQPIAVQISKLRFFISLICEQVPTNDPDTNYGIHALPNLETKFVAANTLIGLNEGNANLFDTTKIKQIKSDLAEVRAKHFAASNAAEKRECRKKDEKLRDQLMEELRTTYGSVISDENAQNMAYWNPYDQNTSSKFFDSVWMFGPELKKGFDIVIGNPPYGAKFSDHDKMYYKDNYESAKTIKGVQKGSLNSFVLFMEKGLSLSNLGGTVSFIVPISITSSDSVTAIHKLITSKCSNITISSYAHRPQQIFVSAGQAVSIITYTHDDMPCKEVLSTQMYRKTPEVSLSMLLDNIQYIDVKPFVSFGKIPKISTGIEASILQKVNSTENTIVSDLLKPTGKKIFYRTLGGEYWKVITNYSTGSKTEGELVLDPNIYNAVGCILSSGLYRWWQQVYCDGHNRNDVKDFFIPLHKLTKDKIEEIEKLYSVYLQDIERNVIKHQKSATIRPQEYKIGKSKHLVDKIDEIICPLYGLTPEEIDFIKNYEIKFRLSDE